MFSHFGRRVVPGLALSALLSACVGSPATPAPDAASLDAPDIAAALAGIQGSQVKQHMTVLAGDELEGRGLGAAGYEGALRYVETTVKGYGLAPAGEAGGYRQRVPLRNSVVVENKSAMTMRSAAGTKTLVYGKDYLLGADPLRENVDLNDAPVAFVGYGVSAPALGYDDYGAGIDVKGKVVAYLSGAPAMLPSNERAYYSSGAVKDAEAIKRGAIGTISFTSPDDPRFRWDVSVATSKQGGYAWVDAQGRPNRGDPALRGSASLNHSGVGGALCRRAEVPGGGLRGRREEHAAGVRPGHPRVDHHDLHPPGRRERQPRRAPRGKRPGPPGRARRLRGARGSLRARRRR